MLKFLIILVAAIIFGAYAYENFDKTFGDDLADEPIACMADAMLCSDGSYVGRSGPGCEFVCPE